MATTTKAMARGAFNPTVSDIYIVPTASTTSIVTNVVITNASTIGQTFTLLLDDVEIFFNTPISGNSTVSVDIKQVLDASGTQKKITGSATSTSVKYHISGVELT